MGLLDQVLGGILGSQGGDGRSSNSGGIADALTELLTPRRANEGDVVNDQTNQPRRGGLDGLMDSFTRAGHREVVDSWVSSGENRPLEPRQLEQALDSNTIDALARRSGLSRDELLRQLSQHLPTAVDRLTPQGRRPKPEDMGHW